jgi:hypothetical protein
VSSPAALVSRSEISASHAGTSTPPLNGTFWVCSPRTSRQAADGAAEPSSSATGSPPRSAPRPSSCGTPALPARPEPRLVHEPPAPVTTTGTLTLVVAPESSLTVSCTA